MPNGGRSIGFLAPAGQSARDVEREHFISAALYLPGNAIGYHVSERLSILYPDKAVVETDDGDFDLEDYARAERCTLAPQPVVYSEWMTSWLRREHEMQESAQNAWLEVTWQGECLDVLILHWDDQRQYFILADSRDVAGRFFAAVCAWNTELHEEVLVFDQGRWSKNDDLFAAIKGATFDNLVLRQGLKEEIVGDATRFFNAQATYERFGVPWKRGILLAGPPGNGKTHAVKALVNRLRRPCLYVKSFRQGDSPDEYGMHSVFEQARLSAPCLLVLEDLDALISGSNRAFFLNEMDGFAANAGILALATTNHPERLDPAIAQRPSRFDRTYRFEVPALAERTAYIERWNASLQSAMRMEASTVTRIAEQTDGFSFAYLKELVLSAMMCWMDTMVPGTMDTVMSTQVDVLRKQMPGATGKTQ